MVDLRNYRIDDVVFVASGGLTEVGSMNDLNLVHKGQVLKLDAGQAIPAEGENLSSAHVPDNTWIFRNDLTVSGVFLSHGHLDHAGGLPWFYDFHAGQKYRPPVLASPYTVRVVEMLEKSQGRNDDLYFALSAHENADPVKDGETRDLDGVTAEFFEVPHSIPGSMGCVVDAGGMRVAYLGDINLYKDDPASEAFKRFLPELRPDVLLLDSTGIEKEEDSKPSKKKVVEEVGKIIRSTSGRVFITLFSSNTERILDIMDLVKRDHPERAIVVSGRSLYQHLEIAGLRSGKDYASYSFPYEYEIPGNAVIFLTGSNGEEMSAMDRMTRGEIDGLYPQENDSVVFSASTIPVPENQEKVTYLLTKLARTGCRIHVSQDVHRDPKFNGDLSVSHCHVSGHAHRNSLKEIVELANPRTIIPVHADRRRREIMRYVFEAEGRNVLMADTRDPVLLSR